MDFSARVCHFEWDILLTDTFRGEQKISNSLDGFLSSQRGIFKRTSNGGERGGTSDSLTLCYRWAKAYHVKVCVCERECVCGCE